MVNLGENILVEGAVHIMPIHTHTQNLLSKLKRNDGIEEDFRLSSFLILEALFARPALSSVVIWQSCSAGVPEH